MRKMLFGGIVHFSPCGSFNQHKSFWRFCAGNLLKESTWRVFNRQSRFHVSWNWLEQALHFSCLHTHMCAFWRKCTTHNIQCLTVRWSPPTDAHPCPFSPQSSPRSPSSSDSSGDDEEVVPWDREGYICAVCLDVYFSPYMCHPCNHIFCEPCLRTLAKNSPANTPCPLCRTTITHVFFQKGEPRTLQSFRTSVGSGALGVRG